jgi:hypothetical protein
MPERRRAEDVQPVDIRDGRRSSDPVYKYGIVGQPSTTISFPNRAVLVTCSVILYYTITSMLKKELKGGA